MRWRDSAFNFRYNAELCKKHLEKEGIQTDNIFRTGYDDYWYVPWQPRSEEQYKTACKVVEQHID